MFFMHRAVDQMAATKMSSSDSVSMKPAAFLEKKKKKRFCIHALHSRCVQSATIPAKVWLCHRSIKEHYLGDFCLYGQKWRAERTLLSGFVLLCPVWLNSDAKRAHCQVIECNGNKAICNCTVESAAHFTHDLHQDNSFGWCNPTPPCPPSVSRSPPLSPELTHNRAAFSVSFFQLDSSLDVKLIAEVQETRGVRPEFPSLPEDKKNLSMEQTCAVTHQSPPLDSLILVAKWRQWVWNGGVGTKTGRSQSEPNHSYAVHANHILN